MRKIEDYEICLSLQRALLDVVTSGLRQVSFCRKGDDIELFFFYDGTPSENERELIGDAAAEVISDFPQFNIDCEAVEIPIPNKIKSRGQVVYSRYES